jgi:TAT (twin-arginine translocation) pathway signal sequence
MSRRQFLGTSAGAAAAMATSPLWFPVLADASGRDPVPIPGGFVPNLYHAFLGPGVEPSTIFNYRGTTGVAAVRGTGTGRNTETGESTPLLFDSDNRFMRGEYISANGQKHEGTFGFV